MLKKHPFANLVVKIMSFVKQNGIQMRLFLWFIAELTLAR